MKPLRTSLLMLLMLCTHFCQAQTLFNENGIELQYEGHEKIGSRYDEYCKTTFDVYRVKATVINKNTDKAANIKAILGFNGFTCNKIYSDTAPISGEVIHKIYALDIQGQSKHASQYWVNSFVHLLPNDEMTAYGEVEVRQNDTCPKPEPYFTYELIPGGSKKADSEPADVHEKATDEKTTGKGSIIIDAPHIIIGEWRLIRELTAYKTGKVEEITDKLSDFLEFEAGGKGRASGYEYSDEFKWVISANNIKLSYDEDYSYTEEILKLNETTLVVRKYAEKNNERGIDYWVSTYKRGLD